MELREEITAERTAESNGSSGLTFTEVKVLGSNFLSWPFVGRNAHKDARNPYKNHAWTYAPAKTKAEALLKARAVVGRASGRDLEDLQLEPIEHPINRVLEDPNPVDTSSDLWKATWINYTLRGRALWHMQMNDGRAYIPRPNTSPDVFWSLPYPDTVTIKKNEQGLPEAYELDGKEYPAESIIDFRDVDPDCWERVVGAVRPLTSTIETDLYAIHYNRNFLKRGAAPGGVLLTERKMDSDQRRDMRKEFQYVYGGYENAGKVAVFSGNVKFQQFDIDHEKMQWSEQQKWNRETAMAAIGTPKLAMGLIDDVNRATGRVAKELWWQDQLQPMLRIAEDAINKHLMFKLFPDRRTRVFFDISRVPELNRTRDQRLDESKALQELGYPLNSINEAQKLQMPEMSWGNTALVSNTLVPVEDVVSGQTQVNSSTNVANDLVDLLGKAQQTKDPQKARGYVLMTIGAVFKAHGKRPNLQLVKGYLASFLNHPTLSEERLRLKVLELVAIAKES